jgi:O-antigen/teichoic acid export membrane protein
MIHLLSNDKQAGIYSAAILISQVWYFVPTIVAATVFPAIIYSKQNSQHLYLSRLQALFDLVTWSAAGLCSLATVCSPFIIALLYGSAYRQSALILSIHIWTFFFMCQLITSNKYLIAENHTRILMYKQLLGAIANIALNFLLLPYFGIVGIALSTLLSYGIILYGASMLFPQSRPLCRMLLKTYDPRRIYHRLSSRSFS